MDKLFTTHDASLLKSNIDRINEQIKLKQNDIFKPNLQERFKIHNIILDFIKMNKRKVYGGYAVNQLLVSKGCDPIYKDYEVPDIDFYSSDPNSDVIKLCNILFDSGYTRVSAREAKHQNTYSIFVNFDLYCDITYMPTNIYKKVPYIIVEDIVYVNPNFMIIDYLRMITDPLNSYWRIEKSFSRLIKLLETFPLPKFNKEIYIGETDNDATIQNAIDIILDDIKNKDIVVVGFYAYNYFLEKSKFTEKNKSIKKINVPYLEIISKNYKEDFDSIMEKLKLNYVDKIEHTEFNPFFIFNGNSVEVYLDGELILIMYDYQKRCHPFIVSNNIKIGTLSLTLMYAQINVIKYRVLDDNDFKLFYMIMVSHLIQMKNYYLSKNKKTIFDETCFKDFVIDCISSDINPDHEQLLKFESRRVQNKPSMFIYDPSKNRKEKKDENFFFANISGNDIDNEKRLKLKDGILDDMISNDMISNDMISNDMISNEEVSDVEEVEEVEEVEDVGENIQ
jgi:hypothetical protein